MKITDVFNSKAVAIVQNKVASNKIPYLGVGLFPEQKKLGLDLSWIKTSSGLPVSLSPSAFDTVSTIRSREGFVKEDTQMAYFKESMLIKEKDRQDMQRIKEVADPYAQEILTHVFDDANTLVEGAKVVPERMRMSLLANASGNPSISFSTVDGATYAYNYDPSGAYATDNFIDVGSADSDNYWNNLTDSDPMADLEKGQLKAEAKCGAKPTIAIMSQATMNLLKQNSKIKGYIVANANSGSVMITEERVKNLLKSELGIDTIVYTKLYKNEAKQVKKFYPDGMVTLVPAGALGKTWFGTTPDEATLVDDPAYDCSIVNTGIAVTVTNSSDPVQTKTTVSEIVLPSFERMDETCMLKVLSSVTY